jgi:hypothetical protein
MRLRVNNLRLFKNFCFLCSLLAFLFVRKKVEYFIICIEASFVTMRQMADVFSYKGVGGMIMDDA